MSTPSGHLKNPVAQDIPEWHYKNPLVVHYLKPGSLPLFSASSRAPRSARLNPGPAPRVQPMRLVLELPRTWKGVSCQKKSPNKRKPGSPSRSRGASSVAAWARQNEVPRRTAFRWARDTKVRLAVEAGRRRALDRAIGRMARLALKAADAIARLGEGAESESVQLRAWRAILADQMAVSKFSNLEQRMVEIEEQLRDRPGHTDHAG